MTHSPLTSIFLFCFLPAKNIRGMTDSNGIFQTNQSIGFYLISDQPTTCPKCGCRTDFERETNKPQLIVQHHRCLSASCGFEFMAIEERDGMKTNIFRMVGPNSTLLNAAKTTNFIYKIENTVLTEQQIQSINEIDTRSKIKDRIQKIQEFSGKLTFIKTENSIFGNNLTLIDSALPSILAEILYLFFTSKSSNTVDLVNDISKMNPLGFNLDNNHPFYSYKLKRLLTDIALGMMPSKVWNGELDATGEYLVVKEDGEVLCYHIYNRNEFEDYLLNNTKLDTPSSTRYDFGTVYSENNQQYFKLNLQIRFLK